MLTALQGAILREIIKFQTETGYGPSIREIASQVGLNSRSSVHEALGRLQDLGYISRSHNKWRSIRILKHPNGAPVGAIQRQFIPIDIHAAVVQENARLKARIAELEAKVGSE